MSVGLQKSELFALVKSPLWALNARNVSPPKQLDYTWLIARVASQGVHNFKDVQGGTHKDGNRYLSIDSFNVVTLDDLSDFTINGHIEIDPLNGAILSHSVTPWNGHAISNAAGAVWPPDVINADGTLAQWTAGGLYRQIALSSPHTLGDLTTAVTDLLDAHASSIASFLTLDANRIWRTGYELVANPFPSGFEYWVPTWTEDPDAPSTLIGAWLNIYSDGFALVLDRDLPDATAAATFLTSELWTPGSVGSDSGPQTFTRFDQGTDGPMEWSASRLLVQRLTASSNHCVREFYDANAISAGNSNNAFSAAADVSGRILLGEAQLTVISDKPDELGTRWFYPNNHPSGATCVP